MGAPVGAHLGTIDLVEHDETMPDELVHFDGGAQVVPELDQIGGKRRHDGQPREVAMRQPGQFRAQPIPGGAGVLADEPGQRQ